MCKNNCKCSKCKNNFLPISGKDVLYYGLPLEIINVEYGEDYENILVKLNQLIQEITTGGNDSQLYFSNVGNGVGILKGLNEFNQVQFKTLISEGGIKITNKDDEISLKVIENFRIYNTKLDFESDKLNLDEGYLIYIKNENRYYKFNNNDNLVDPFPEKLDKPIEQGVEDLEYLIPAYKDGKPYWRNSSEFGKVKTVNNQEPDVNRNINIGLKEVLSIDNEDLSQSINVSILKTTSNLEEDVYENRPTSLTLGYSMTGFTTIDDVKYTTDGSIIDFSDNRTGRSLMLLPDTLKYQNVTLILPTEKSGVLALTSDIKVKTVNDLEPDEEGNIDLGIIPAEFVKNGLGWSLKYAIDNPAKYEPTGLNAINLSKAYSDSTTMLGASGKDSTAIGAYTLAKGNNSTAIGWSSKSYGSQSLAIGYSNISYSAFSTVIGGQANIIGVESEILTPISGQNTRASIFGGQNNKIINGRYATIVGGHSNTITATSKYNITSNPLGQNSILGGYSNTITDAENSVILGGDNNNIVGHKVERNWAVTVAGGENIGKGSYSTVFGYRNKSITQGETLVGMLSTTQDEALLPNTYYPSSRMFGVGVGNLDNNNTEVRKDGFNVYQNGLVTAPSLTTSLIEANNKAVTTKEFVDNKISNFSLPTNWSSSQQRMSDLPNKNSDLTFTRNIVQNSLGELAYVDLLTSEFIKFIENGKVGFALKYRKDNPTFYSAIGNNAVDLSIQTISSKGGASGNDSVAIGLMGKSTGLSSTSLGNSNIASGNNSLSAGTMNTASGSYSLALGYLNTASQGGDNAIGYRNIANGGYATAMGVMSEATGTQSVAMGTSSRAVGKYSTAIGYGVKSSTEFSMAIGNVVESYSYNSIVMGSYNVVKTGQSQTGNPIVPTDDLFVIGNGFRNPTTGIATYSNALEIRNNGHTLLPSTTVPMIEGNVKSVITKEYLDIRIPKPPTTGEYVLKSVDGVVSWVLN